VTDDLPPRLFGGGVHAPEAKPVALRCPFCGRNGSFTRLLQHDIQWQQKRRESDSGVSTYYAGLRRCPAEDCGGVVFVLKIGSDHVVTYPAQTVDFDATNLPPTVRHSLEEAIKCHAVACFRASALMIRRTLEEVCEDRGATGGNLKARLSSLGSKTVIPKELLEAADELRILGNDAAHVEAKDYDNIGAAEVEVALMLTKEILKGVYQYADLVKALRALKKPVP
jgi:hypothetical protein